MEYCCEQMEENSTLNCDQHKSVFECPDILMFQSTTGDTGIIVHDGGPSYILIRFCPWCGKKLKYTK